MAKLNRNKKLFITIEMACDKYMTYCKSKNLSKETLKAYEVALTRLYTYLPEMPIDELTMENLYYFMDEFRQHHQYGVRSTNNLYRNLNIFFGWCKRQGLIDKELKFDYQKQPKKLQPVPSTSEVRKLLIAPNIEDCNYNEFVGHCMTAIVVSLGLRISSIVALKTEDVDFKNNEIIVKTTKNKREYRMPMTKKLKKIIENYLHYIESDSEYLFTTIKDTPITSHLGSMNIIRYARSRGVETSAHALRRYFACEFMKSTGNIMALSRILMHSSVEITELYVANLNIQSFSSELEEHNPLDKLL